jgi:hypothetical protein
MKAKSGACALPVLIVIKLTKQVQEVFTAGWKIVASEIFKVQTPCEQQRN